ncbi:MAG: SRPBCC family protein [Desulfobacterales bacterium]
MRDPIRNMRYPMSVAAGAGIGIGLMYLLDPQTGRRRRALVRDKSVHGKHVTGEAAGKISRDMRHRAHGFSARLKRVTAKEEVPDSVLVDRVRTELGGVVGHPGSIHVEANDGRIRLTGVILEHELSSLLDSVKSVRGVREVEHDLEVHKEPGNVPGLQGEPALPLAGGQFELLQENWSPAVRFVTGLAGGALTVYGVTSRGLAGTAAAVTGIPLVTRAATNMPLRRLVGLSGRRGVDIQKSMTIQAPVTEVFQTLRRAEDFPKFMTHVKEVVKLDEGHYQWTVTGPAGIPVKWTSAVTSIVPDKELRWKSERGSRVRSEGIVQVVPNRDGSTTVNLRLTYNPVIGGIGHAALSALGAYPKRLLDDEFMRLKTVLETGKLPRDAAARQHGQ